MVFPIFRQGRTILMENLKKIKDKMDVICLAIGGILLLYAGSEEEFTTCSDWWLAFLVASGIGFLYVATRIYERKEFNEEKKKKKWILLQFLWGSDVLYASGLHSPGGKRFGYLLSWYGWFLPQIPQTLHICDSIGH